MLKKFLLLASLFFIAFAGITYAACNFNNQCERSKGEIYSDCSDCRSLTSCYKGISGGLVGFDCQADQSSSLEECKKNNVGGYCFAQNIQDFCRSQFGGATGDPPWCKFRESEFLSLLKKNGTSLLDSDLRTETFVNGPGKDHNIWGYQQKCLGFMGTQCAYCSARALLGAKVLIGKETIKIPINSNCVDKVKVNGSYGSAKVYCQSDAPRENGYYVMSPGKEYYLEINVIVKTAEKKQYQVSVEGLRLFGGKILSMSGFTHSEEFGDNQICRNSGKACGMYVEDDLKFPDDSSCFKNETASVGKCATDNDCEMFRDVCAAKSAMSDSKFALANKLDCYRHINSDQCGCIKGFCRFHAPGTDAPSVVKDTKCDCEAPNVWQPVCASKDTCVEKTAYGVYKTARNDGQPGMKPSLVKTIATKCWAQCQDLNIVHYGVCEEECAPYCLPHDNYPWATRGLGAYKKFFPKNKDFLDVTMLAYTKQFYANESATQCWESSKGYESIPSEKPCSYIDKDHLLYDSDAQTCRKVRHDSQCTWDIFSSVSSDQTTRLYSVSWIPHDNGLAWCNLAHEPFLPKADVVVKYDERGEEWSADRLTGQIKLRLKAEGNDIYIPTQNSAYYKEDWEILYEPYKKANTCFPYKEVAEDSFKVYACIPQDKGYDCKDPITEAPAISDRFGRPAYYIINKDKEYLFIVTVSFNSRSAVEAWWAKQNIGNRAYADQIFLRHLYWYDGSPQGAKYRLQFASSGFNLLSDKTTQGMVQREPFNKNAGKFEVVPACTTLSIFRSDSINHGQDPRLFKSTSKKTGLNFCGISIKEECERDDDCIADGSYDEICHNIKTQDNGADGFRSCWPKELPQLAANDFSCRCYAEKITDKPTCQWVTSTRAITQECPGCMEYEAPVCAKSADGSVIPYKNSCFAKCLNGNKNTIVSNQKVVDGQCVPTTAVDCNQVCDRGGSGTGSGATCGIRPKAITIGHILGGLNYQQFRENYSWFNQKENWFFNKCYADCAQARNQGDFIIEKNQCKAGFQLSDCGKCPKDIPVCATTGDLYQSKCEALCAGKTISDKLRVINGKCQETIVEKEKSEEKKDEDSKQDESSKESSQSCSCQNEKIAPVCAFGKGETTMTIFKNKCEAGCAGATVAAANAYINQGKCVIVQDRGVCMIAPVCSFNSTTGETKCTDPCGTAKKDVYPGCIEDGIKVCGEDGKIYDTACHAYAVGIWVQSKDIDNCKSSLPDNQQSQEQKTDNQESAQKNTTSTQSDPTTTSTSAQPTSTVSQGTGTPTVTTIKHDVKNKSMMVGQVNLNGLNFAQTGFKVTITNLSDPKKGKETKHLSAKIVYATDSSNQFSLPIPVSSYSTYVSYQAYIVKDGKYLLGGPAQELIVVGKNVSNKTSSTTQSANNYQSGNNSFDNIGPSNTQTLQINTDVDIETDINNSSNKYNLSGNVIIKSGSPVFVGFRVTYLPKINSEGSAKSYYTKPEQVSQSKQFSHQLSPEQIGYKICYNAYFSNGEPGALNVLTRLGQPTQCFTTP